MRTSFFTFGQAHVHRVNGRTFDADVVVEINAEDPRARMVQLFGDKWAFEYYEECPDLKHFPRGVVRV